MTDEISIIKSNINATVDSIKDYDVEFILLPFGDPDIGPPINETASGFIDMVHLIEENGGNDCPEESLGAIKMALEWSQPNSYIYVFTDARPRTKDIDQINTITNLCETQKSQVLIFLTGKCSPTETIDAVYYDVAKNCRGSVVFYDLGSLRYAFKYIKETVKTQWNQVDAQYDFLREKNISFAVDMYTTDMMISIAGEHPDIEIINHFGEKVDVQRIINTSTACVVIMQQLTEGEYKAAVTGGDFGMVTIYTRRTIHVEFGFSSKIPRSLDETSKAPIPGIKCYILVILDANLELTSIKLQIAKTGEEIHLQYQALDETRGYYIANNIFEHGKTFKLSITARHKENNSVIEGVTPPVKPQEPGMLTEWMKPEVQIIGPEMNWAEFGDSTTFACKVTAFPKPRIIWEDDIGNTLPSQCVLVEIPSVYLTYANVANATRNANITCMAENAMGADAISLKLFVNRTNTFNVLKSPSDITVGYGEEGKLYCEVDAYPTAEITWLHNNTAVVENDNIMFEPEEHTLVIRNMDIESTGEYICKIENEVESRSLGASVFITGLEMPEVNVESSEVLLQPGDFTEQQCSITKGLPLPIVSWKYKLSDGYEYIDIPEGVYVKDGTLKISSAETFHGGVYVCEAENILGTDMDQITVKVQFAPRIKNKDESMVVRRGDAVTLACNVEAFPKAQVHWEMQQDDVIIALDSSHKTDESHTHTFVARANDSGTYYCIAENSMGKAVRTVNVTVMVSPYIKPPLIKNITQPMGTDVNFECYVARGSPVPSSRWEFMSPNGNITLLATGHSIGPLNYILKNISKRDEGIYRCTADNMLAVDTIRIALKIIQN
ncbi:hemicentin-1-like [Leptidea sinapis]|uniref:hemicentin-1-like n=1 Tax=Leptidea sinapis TaxID=189913 RepID=UPI0021C3A58D|nr:hemicentin-1-like [Leptidea sinapis]